MKKYRIIIENWQGDTSALQISDKGNYVYAIELSSKGNVQATFKTQKEAEDVAKNIYNEEQDKIQADTKNLSTAPAWNFEVVEIGEEDHDRQ